MGPEPEARRRALRRGNGASSASRVRIPTGGAAEVLLTMGRRMLVSHKGRSEGWVSAEALDRALGGFVGGDFVGGGGRLIRGWWFLLGDPPPHHIFGGNMAPPYLLWQHWPLPYLFCFCGNMGVFSSRGPPMMFPRLKATGLTGPKKLWGGLWRGSTRFSGCWGCHLASFFFLDAPKEGHHEKKTIHAASGFECGTEPQTWTSTLRGNLHTLNLHSSRSCCYTWVLNWVHTPKSIPI